MEDLQRILGQESGHLVTVLMGQPGFSPDRAEHFVAVAGRDLIASYEWQAEELDPDDLSSRTNVSILLAGIHANEIAAVLSLSRADVWRGLRAFVPTVLALANCVTENGRMRCA